MSSKDFRWSPLVSLSLLLSVGASAACTARSLDAGTRIPNDAGSGLGFLGPDGSGEAGLGGLLGGDDGACTVEQDQSCNDDLQQSSFAGKCVGGRCKCLPGYSIVPGGKCRAAKGLGAGCGNTSECYAGLECLDFAVHPKADVCSVQGKQCTISCDVRAQGPICDELLGPGVHCFAGCEGNAGICGQTP